MATITQEDAEDVVNKFDETCWQCGGDGKSHNGVCGICDGVGMQLTDAGRQMIAFIARNEKRIAKIREQG